MKGFSVKTIIFCIFFCAATAGSLFAALTQDQRKELSLHYYRGVVYYEAGRYQEALAEFQDVTNIDPFYKDAKNYMEECLRVLDQYRQDVTHTNVADTANKEGVELYFLGKAYYEKGEYFKALETFRAVLEKSPEDKFAQYYAKLCRDALPPAQAKKGRLSKAEGQVVDLEELNKEIAYMKSDIRQQEDVEKFLRAKAERKSVRDDLIRAKERQLKEQEELLEEERQDYMAQAKISKQAERIRRETEKWRNMKEKLASEQPGVPTGLTDYPVYLDRADKYYTEMKEALRTSRWNSAGLNAVGAAIGYCDALLIYFYNVKSAEPKHENITRLLLENVNRADTQANVQHMRSILNVKKLVDDDDRPMTRAEAVFLSQHTEKLVEWCRSILP